MQMELLNTQTSKAMTDKDKELARKILNKRASDTINGLYHYDSLFELMQAYHEAKMKEVTDEDISKHRELTIGDEGNPYNGGYFDGAKAMREGEIKHIEK
jgi:hypothetical protein